MTNYLIYGATGYTGSLLAREAVRQGHRPILAGRNGPAVNALANELGLEARTVGLDDSTQLARNLQGVMAVVHCAGPFSSTSKPMADACLQARVHYLDITGEEDVFAALAAQDAEARAAGVMLLPGIGFDVVPSDCLAAHLKRRLPTATHLTLAFQTDTPMSRGTALTVVESLAKPGLVRVDGKLTPVPAGSKTLRVDFGRGPVTAMRIPWGDVVTAFHSTGIGNIEVYMAAPWSMRIAARVCGLMTGILGSRTVQSFLARRIKAGPPGPSAEQRQKGKTHLWGQVRSADGQTATARLAGPDGYDFTVHAALAVVKRVLAGHCPHGFQTPSLAYGPDFVLELPQVTRTDA